MCFFGLFIFLPGKKFFSRLKKFFSRPHPQYFSDIFLFLSLFLFGILFSADATTLSAIANLVFGIAIANLVLGIAVAQHGKTSFWNSEMEIDLDGSMFFK